MKYYSGIGSRTAPDDILKIATKIAIRLESQGYTLRSGNAMGMDQAFAKGVSKNAQIWLPSIDFNADYQILKPDHDYRVIGSNDYEAFNSIENYHPNPKRLSKFARLLMARNYRQVVGKDEPNSSFVICYTIDGKFSGGTGQSLRLANDLGIKIINLYHYQKTALEEFLT